MPKAFFYDMDGNILSSQVVAHGHAAKAPKAPEKEPTGQYCYPFTGWDGDITNITADAAFYPTYGTEIRSYTVTFMNGDTVFNKQTVKYGKSAVTPIEPKKEADAEYSYHFVGWDGDYSFITGDMVIHALYEQKELPPKNESEKGKDTEKKEEEIGDKGEDKSGNENGGETGSVSDNNIGESIAPVIGEDSGEELESSTGADNGESLNIDSGLFAKKQTYNTDVSDRTPLGKILPFIVSEMEAPAEIQAEERLTEELPENMDDVEQIQETATEDTAEADKGITAFGWIMFLLGIIISGLLLLWSVFSYLARRKVCGTILDESGNVPCGIQITLSGKDILETEPDEEGRFCFDGLKKDDRRLNVYDGDGNKLFSADIHMEKGNEEAVFLVLESDCIRVETNRKKRIYEINLTV